MPDTIPRLRAAAKPLRLRAACNQCHIAKVSMVGRASKRRQPRAGQQTATSSLEGRRSRSPDELSQTLDSEGGQATSSVSRPRSNGFADGIDSSAGRVRHNESNISTAFPLSDTNNSNLPATELLTSEDVAAMSSAPELDFLDHQLHHLDESGNIGEPCLHLICSQTGCITADDGFLFSGLADGQALQFGTTPGSDVLFAQPELLARSSRMVPIGYRDTTAVARYPHAAALMGIIDSLESCIQRETAPMVQVLSLNRTALVRLPAIMVMEGFKACNSCPILAITALDLVVGMFNGVLSSMQVASQQGGMSVMGDADCAAELAVESSLLPMRSTNPPSLADAGNKITPTSEAASAVRSVSDATQCTFTFGCLELEQEEQVILRNVLLKRDLLKCVKTIQSFRHEMRSRWEATHHNSQGTGGGLSTASRGAAQDIWFDELEKKAGELLASVDGGSSLDHQ
ncbi:unnamed protein product [Clonostachys rosea]|uniref:Uncharacterized protein n=1 Tax=Bionectria ochroleuca TaxID=29856 RepID=A0ABY6UIS5_BIOOC|nr:unnamed protein product [Clonostachys rosea]